MPKSPLPWVSLLTTLTLLSAQTVPYNLSLCADIEVDDLHYYINSQQDNKDLTYKDNLSTVTYNLCKGVEVYCPQQNAIVNASLVAVNPADGSCVPYIQTGVTYLDGKDPKSGIKVLYQ